MLDEAHCIKDRACNTAKAVFALASKYKWALSGTPLQVGGGRVEKTERKLRVQAGSIPGLGRQDRQAGQASVRQDVGRHCRWGGGQGSKGKEERKLRV